MSSPRDSYAPWVLEQLRSKVSALGVRFVPDHRERIELAGCHVYADPHMPRGAAPVVLLSVEDFACLRRGLAERCTVEVSEPVVLRDNPEGFGKRAYWRGKPAYFYQCKACDFCVQIGVDGACGEAVLHRHTGCNKPAFLLSVVDVVVDFMLAVGK